MTALRLLVVATLYVGSAAVVFQYQFGCFRDEAVGGDLNRGPGSAIEYVVTSQKLSGSVCCKICFDKGFMYAAVRRSECKCTEAIANLEPANVKKCDIPCVGDPEQMCGGMPNLSAAYITSIYDEPPAGKRVGCMEDADEFRLIPEHRLELKLTNTPSRCIGICLQLGFTYAGLRHSYECFCGSLRKHGPTVKGCNIPCPINKALNCGGIGRTMVYRTTTQGGMIPTTGVDYLGCYKPNSGFRKLECRKEITATTTYACIAECYIKGFELAGLLDGNKCHCGVLGEGLETPRSVPESQCSIPCTGQPNSKCGGRSHYSIYTTGIVGDGTFGKALGCFRDTPNSFRANEQLFLWSQNSPKECIYECMKLGNAFAAVKKTECRCGNWWPKNLDVEDSCNAQCPYSGTQTCGGERFIGVYRTGLDSSINLDVLGASQTPEKNEDGVLFREDFNNLDLNKWKRTIKISGEDDEFTIYTANYENSHVHDGNLVIVPTIEEDDFVRRGSVRLTNCTGRRGTRQCTYESKFFQVLPPTKSAQLCTSKSFNFKYGKVTVRAKLPVGDWILPQIWLKPSSEEYGEGYMSGKVVIASVPGNKDLMTLSGENMGWEVLKTGILASNGPDQPSRNRILFVKADEPWPKEFHEYTLVWTPERMSFFTDKNEINAKTIYDAGKQSVGELLGFDDPGVVWSGGSRSAPFDKEFHICLGVGVGGYQGFPDGIISNGKAKPWANFEVKSQLKFWQAQNDWRQTWSYKSRMEIDSVTVTRV